MVKASDVILILVAILFPPAAALFITGCSCDFLINICLTVFGYIPGHLHAFWLIYKKMRAEEQYGHGGFQCKCCHGWMQNDTAPNQIAQLRPRDVGNGQYEPIYNAPGGAAPAQAPINYGATGGNYVR